MQLTKKIAATLGAGVLLLGLAGTVLAATGPEVTPTYHSGNITLSGTFGVNVGICPDALYVDSTTTEATSPDGVKVTITYHSDTKTTDFVATGGLVMIAYVKGGNGYNEYDYRTAGIASDDGLVAPDNGSNDAAGLSHAIFCTEAGDVPSDGPSFDASQEAETTQPATNALPTSDKTSGPADASWLLVVAMGVLLASAVVLTPSRVRNRR